MRPDEHKRKKNDAYKKKHGMKPPGGVKSAGKSSAQEQPGKPRGRPHVPPNVTQATPSDDEEDRVTNDVPKPTFQRRKVESNWDRYSETPVSQEEERVGADFTEILASSSTGFSQFRFKDEQEWEKGEEEENSFSPLLSIDCTALARHVTCVPLHERLQIDAQHFNESQLRNAVKQATVNKSLLQTSCTQSNTNSTSTDIYSNQHHPPLDPTQQSIIEKLRPGNSKTKDNDEHACIEQNLTSQGVKDELDDILDDSVNDNALADILCVDSKCLSVLDKQSNSIETMALSTQKSNSDITETNVTIDDIIVTETKTNDSGKATTLEDDLDALLNLDSDVPSHVVPSNTQAAVVSQKVQSENLEDWLDAVLDE